MASIIVSVKPRFHDLKLKWEGELSDPSTVISYIDSRLPEWLAANSPSLWLKLSGDNLRHLPFFLDHGFTMHRIKNGTTLVLNRWIRAGVPNLPPGPFAYLGCAGLVLDDQNRVLSIRENYYNSPGLWKLPGGLFDPSKDGDIGAGAVRECFEETGIRAEFQCILLERFMPVSRMFRKNDIYVICRLNPLTTEIKSDPVEVAECQWVPQDEFLAGCDRFAHEFLARALSATNGLRGYPAGSMTVYHAAEE
jgi:8-oxo-dGTP pyrophosphatase MutT (NUDIX family)